MLPVSCASGVSGNKGCSLQPEALHIGLQACQEGEARDALCSCRRRRAAGADLLAAGLLHSELHAEK